MSRALLLLPRLLGAFRRREWPVSVRNPRGCPAAVKVRVWCCLGFATPFDLVSAERSFDHATTLVGLVLCLAVVMTAEWRRSCLCALQCLGVVWSFDGFRSAPLALHVFLVVAMVVV